MKPTLLLWMVISSLVFSCSSTPEATIKFCASLDQHDQCTNDRDHFTLGEKVYVRCESEEPFETNKITGSIFRMEKGEKIFLSNHDFELKAEDSYITQNIPFNEFGLEGLGVFQVEFTNEKGEIIAKRTLTITQN